MGSDLVLLHVRLERCGDADRSGFCNAAGAGVVERSVAECSGSGACRITRPALSGQRLTLLNTLHAPRSSHASKVAELFSKIESLGYVLAWMRSDREEMAVDLVELPRLRLSFETRYEDGEVRFYCREHAGLFIATRSCPNSERLLGGLPCAMLLMNRMEELFLVVNAAVKPVRPSQPEYFPSAILLDRQDRAWLSKLSAKYYLYPVHISRRFLTMPSLASMLYMLVLRFLSREYEEVFKMANSCVSDTELSNEEKQVILVR